MDDSIPYLFRTYNGNKYVLNFDPNDKIEDAIYRFESEEFNFKDVEIYPIEDQNPNYDVQLDKSLGSFSSRRFLLCARYTRNSKPYKIQKLDFDENSNIPEENTDENSNFTEEDINEDCFMKTPVPNRNIEKSKKESNLLIQQFNNIMKTNPDIFDEILEVAKNANEDHFNILKNNRSKIEQLLINYESKSEECFSLNNSDDTK